MNGYGIWGTYTFVINGKEVNVVAKDIERARELANKKYKRRDKHE
ncbi:hypothetical protein LXJ15735_28000 [Lacrimispora xylanolytica]